MARTRTIVIVSTATVVAAGAKAILDLPKTWEVLETTLKDYVVSL